MRHILYRKYLQKNLFFQVIILILAINFIGGPLFAQQQRRGVFLQDELPQSDNRSSFGAPGEVSDDEISDEDLLADPYGRRGSRIGQSGATLSPSMSYQVHVLGEVKRPGTYRVSPSTRVTDALRLAGGIKKNGSERFVELRSQGRTTGKDIDLFEYKTLGRVSQNPYLQDNQTVFVPLKERAVEIEGPVRRPGVYELKNERSLADLVKVAGGFTVGASNENPLKVIRYYESDQKKVFEIDDNYQDMSDFRLEDGDVVVVEHKFLTKHSFDYNLRKLPNDNIFYPAFEDKVFVIGAVRAPGPLPFNQYYTLRQYLTLAGGTTTMAKNKKIQVVTVDGTIHKAKNGHYDGVVNPGDTIVVPEKSIPTSFYIGLLPTIASIGLSAAALFR